MCWGSYDKGDQRRESGCDGRYQWHKLQGMTKVELVGTHTKERACEWQLVFSIRVDTRKSKGGTKIKDYLEKDYWEKDKQGWGMGQKVLVRKRDELMRLLARSDDEDET